MAKMVYYVIYSYGTTSATTTEANAVIDTFVGQAPIQEHDHIKFGPGIYRYDATQNVTPIAGDYSMTTFGKGTWPPPPGRAMEVFNMTSEQLYALVAQGAGLDNATPRTALFIYQPTQFILEKQIEITACIGSKPVINAAHVTLTEGVYRIPAQVGGDPSSTVIRAVDFRETPKHQPSPAFDSVTFDDYSLPRLTAQAVSTFGSSQSIYEKLLGTRLVGRLGHKLVNPS